MLMPRRVKYRKQHRYHTRGVATRGNTVVFGEYGIQALEPAYVTARQIEAARRAITNAVRRGGKVWIRIFPDKPVTKKPAETRMGGGKGNPEYWMDVVKPGRILFELAGVREDLAHEALTRAIYKLPCKCRIVKRESGTEAAPVTES
jgi:large subunit ribosomal protein L16